ncbi:MAG: hypothetical protein ACREJC_06095, partial [Tepidisphaeraceae bacterium]
EYTYSLRSVSEDGMRHDAEVNVSRSTAFVSLEMTPKGASAPFFALTKIVLNEPIEAGRYRRPDMSRVIGRAKAGEAELDAWARPEIFDDVMLTWAYRRAIYEPNLRPTLERFYGKVDWNNARKQDRATTSVFREIVEKSTTRRTTPQQP